MASSAPTTVEEMREWIINWIATTTGSAPSEINDQEPMDNLGLSSRDVVVLSGELENMLETQLDATIVYEYPTIAVLSRRLIEGPSIPVPTASGSLDYTPLDQSQAGVHDIAVIGYSARFAGGENNEDFWRMLVESRTGITEPPEGRWAEHFADETVARQLAEAKLAGGYLKDLKGFDAEFFGIAPLEAENMDPQQRLTLEVAWEALLDAGLPANELRGTAVGVFIGSTSNDYQTLITADPEAAHPYALTGTASSIIPNRVSYAFDFRGPSVSVDTACSSSLVAVHQAVRALRGGEADVALAGGVNILASPFASSGFDRLGMFSPTGGIHAFSDDADGIVRSDGVGLVVLKRVDDAIKDGDDIRAVIRGSAINSDGHSNGLTAPNPEAQVDVLQRAYRDARVNPTEVDYVEAHGTGTILGDPIEAGALGAVLGAGRETDQPTLLGSAKTNFGHSEAAAGAAGLIKVVRGIEEDVIPASLNYAAPNRYIDFDGAHIEVVDDAREWPAYSGRRIAGVSGFGFGGTNAHVVVSEYVASDYGDIETKEIKAQLDDGNAVLPVSGLVPSRMRDAAASLADFIDANREKSGFDLIGLERDLVGRNHGRSRGVAVADNVDDAIARLRALADGRTPPGAYTSTAKNTEGPVFVYSGFGSQHKGMGKALCEASDLFADRMKELAEVVEFESGWSLMELITSDDQGYGTETAQVAITAIQIALTDLLAAAGVHPGAVTAMSMGELAAAYATGGLAAEDVMHIACHRARLMAEAEEMYSGDKQAAMAVVECSDEQLKEIIASDDSFAGVETAVFTAPGMITVGGPQAAVKALVERFESEEKFARLLPVKGAGHTSMLDPILPELAGEIAGLEPRPLSVPLFSSVDKGRRYRAGEVVHDEDYFLRCTRQNVWFQDATELALAEGYSTFIEISPNPVAVQGMTSTAYNAQRPDTQLLFTLKRKLTDVESLRDLLATVYVNGVDVNLRIFHGPGHKVTGPETPWRRQEFWTKARPAGSALGSAAGGLFAARVALPDHSVAFTSQAASVPSALSLMEAAVGELDAAATLISTNEIAPLPKNGEISTVAAKRFGGVSVSIYALHQDSSITLAEGFATTGQAPDATPSAPVATPPATEDTDGRWNPESGESVRERLSSIISETMGYDVDDLPLELPLIDLGLDSLMGMRIKNRVEHEFSIPPIEVQTLRDASVASVIEIVEKQVNDQHTNPEPAAAAKPHSGKGGGVAPRDASERTVFATWSSITGDAPAGVTSTLPEIDEETATAIAERLTERGGVEITTQAVREAETLEPLADLVREGLETDVEGNIRVLRERPEGSTAPTVFLFHPAGGSSVVYQPLTRRLPEEIPVYGVERREGSLEERCAAYLDDIVSHADGHKVVLGGWSFGGALAYEVASQLKTGGYDVDVELIALIDTVRPAHPAPDTLEETKARWQRYSDFAEKTYGIGIPVPFDLIEQEGEGALLEMLKGFFTSADASDYGLASGVLEHQRASFVDNRILDTLDFSRWSEVDVPVILYRAERMHDGAIELEPAYADIEPDGGWGSIVSDLEIVQLRGDHLGVVDEPEIKKVGEHLTDRIKDLG